MHSVLRTPAISRSLQSASGSCSNPGQRSKGSRASGPLYSEPADAFHIRRSSRRSTKVATKRLRRCKVLRRDEPRPKSKEKFRLRGRSQKNSTSRNINRLFFRIQLNENCLRQGLRSEKIRTNNITRIEQVYHARMASGFQPGHSWRSRERRTHLCSRERTVSKARVAHLQAIVSGSPPPLFVFTQKGRRKSVIAARH